MTVCEILGLHNLVQARRLKFEMKEDASLPGHYVPALLSNRMHEFVIIGRVDGMACVRCDYFEPSSGSPSHPPTTTWAART